MGYPSHYECITERQQSASDDLGLSRIPSSAPTKRVVQYKLVHGRLVQVMAESTLVRKSGSCLGNKR
jgi:hypothetical protein